MFDKLYEIIALVCIKYAIYYAKEDLEEHILIAHKDKCYMCICGEKFISLELLNEHGEKDCVLKNYLNIAKDNKIKSYVLVAYRGAAGLKDQR